MIYLIEIIFEDHSFANKLEQTLKTDAFPLLANIVFIIAIGRQFDLCCTTKSSKSTISSLIVFPRASTYAYLQLIKKTDAYMGTSLISIYDFTNNDFNFEKTPFRP